MRAVRGAAANRRSAAALVAGVVIVLLVTQLGVTVMRIEGNSMERTLTPGSMVLVVRPFALRAASWLSGEGFTVQYPVGSVVALNDPRRSSSSGAEGGELLVKRVVAVGPATVSLNSGELLVDGHPQAEPWLANDLRGATQLPERTIKPGELFVLGDNRLPLASRDSRSFGPVPEVSVQGKVVAVLQLPWSRADGWREAVLAPL